MKSIKGLIQGLKIEERADEFNAFKIMDDNFQTVQERLDALEKRNLKYFCAVHRTTVQVIPQNVKTNIEFDFTEHPQFGNMHDNANTNERVYIRRNGVYHISGGLQFEGSSAGTIRELAIVLVRGLNTYELTDETHGPLTGNAPLHMSIATSFYLYTGDYITLAATHDVAGGLDVEVDYPHSPCLRVAERMEDLSPDEYGLLDPDANMR